MKNKKKWISVTVVLLIVTNLITAVIFSGGYFFVPKSSDIAQFKKLFLVKEILDKKYDGEIDQDKLVEYAIKGMTSTLDPYTVFMNKEEFEEFTNQIQGEKYIGLGIQIAAKDDKIVIITAFDKSPAKEAGLLSGDVIQKVNDIPVAAEDLEKAVSMMKGELGRKVKLTIYREGKGSFDVDLKAAEIEMQTVSGEMISDDVGYIKISMFDENTDENFNNKLKELEGKGMKGLILDLRDNPGGDLQVCVNIASNFIAKDSVVVYTVEKDKTRTDYKSKGGLAIGMPLVILTNGGTASASEVVSGAIKDYNAGVLIGEKTFGKGVVQTMYNTGDGTALKVTIAKYYTPKGTNIHHIGIEPDIEVKYPENLKEEIYDRTKDPQFKAALDKINTMIK